MQSFVNMISFDGAFPSETVPRLTLAVGVFDGVHLGHRQILRTTCEVAHSNGSIACAVTFDPHPRSVFGYPPELLVPFKERKRRLRACGAEIIGTINFSKEVAALEPQDFLLALINDRRFELAGICVGEHWHFGKAGMGGKELLSDFAEKYHFAFRAVPELYDGKEIISSSSVRQLFSSGNLERGAAMLGASCQLSGKVVKGFGVAGNKLAAPTANLDVECGIIPPDGVYAGQVKINGAHLPAAVNIGVAPTFNVGKRRVEIHLLDWNGDLYDSEITLEIVKFIRSERKFASADDLKKQIALDITDIRNALNI